MVYFIGTPIGNLKEITYRAVETLSCVDAVFCEDTRHSRILLSHYGIDKPLYSYHKYKEKESLAFVLSKAEKGDIAVISDAGMPCVSDPGSILVNALKQANVPYTVISGPCAFVNAFVMSGYSSPFAFAGFLPEKNADRDRLIETLDTENTTVFYVSVHNLVKDLAYLSQKLGDREACLIKELSKIHEEARFIRLSEPQNDDKGEFVLVVKGETKVNPLCLLSVKEHIKHYTDLGMSKNEAVKLTAKDRHVGKNEIYKYTLK